MNSPKPVVVVVDDDPSVLRALRRLISGAGFEVRVFDRPSALLKDDLPKTDACLVVDVHLPEMSGVELCETLGASGCRLPVVLITAHADDETRTLGVVMAKMNANSLADLVMMADRLGVRPSHMDFSRAKGLIRSS